MKILNLYEGSKVWITKKGYPTIWRGGKSKMVHVLEWEKHNGPKPQGMQIHHKDENKSNWNIENLQLVTPSDHLKIHAGWVMLDGEWVSKPCKDCKQILSLDSFYQRKGLTPSNRCIECSSLYFKNQQTQEYKDKRKLYMIDYYNKHKTEKWGIKD